MKRGVIQECVISPDFLILNSGFDFRDLEEIEERLTVNGKLIYNIRYADNTVLLASSQTDLQTLLNDFQVSCAKLALSLNIYKTKVMKVSKNHQYL